MIASDPVGFELKYFNQQDNCIDYGLVYSTDEQIFFVDAYGTMLNVIKVIVLQGSVVELHLQLSSGFTLVMTATIMQKVQQLTNGSK